MRMYGMSFPSITGCICRFVRRTHLIKELSPVVPRLLENWLKIADGELSLFAAASALSWNEIFPDTINALVIQDAESLLSKSPKLGGVTGSGRETVQFHYPVG